MFEAIARANNVLPVPASAAHQRRILPALYFTWMVLTHEGCVKCATMKLAMRNAPGGPYSNTPAGHKGNQRETC